MAVSKAAVTRRTAYAPVRKEFRLRLRSQHECRYDEAFVQEMVRYVGPLKKKVFTTFIVINITSCPAPNSEPGFYFLGVMSAGYEQKQRWRGQQVCDGLTNEQVKILALIIRGVCDSYGVGYDSVRRTRSAPP